MVELGKACSVGGLDAQRIIGVWERGRHASSHERAQLLAELSGFAPEAAESMALGTRDAALAAQRIATYGAKARASVTCPACSEPLEFGIDFEALRDLGFTRPGEGPWALSLESFRVEFRLPTSADLRAVAGSEAAVAARALLLERVVLSAEREGDTIPAALLPEPIVAALEAEIEQLDPISDVRFGQTCPACLHRFVAPFDVASFCWHELDVDARRLLQEVDLLARTYGWSEAEILGMSRVRRLTYLELGGLA